MSSAMLEVRELVRAFGGVRAVDHASFDVRAGTVTALIGPNGAGKSTLFNCVSGFLRADGGTVSFEGRRIDRRAPHRIARAGLVRTFQTAHALRRMSVLDNVRLAAPGHPGERLTAWVARPASVRSRERKVTERAHELLDLVRLDEHAGALSGTLSGGQRKLLDLARVLMAEPRLVLLDEPMAGVNPALREELLTQIVTLRDGHGVTFLVVEHDLDFVMKASDHVVVMSEGHVIAEGTPDVVRADERVIDAYLGPAHGR